jgi:2-alkenal reductase
MNIRTRRIAPLILTVIFLAGCVGAAPSALQPVSVQNPQPVSYQVTQEQVLAPTATALSDSVIQLVDAYQAVLEEVYSRVNPSVVNVEVVVNLSGSQGNSFGYPSQGVQTGLGSGFVWDTNGHIVTNNHVIENADQIRVTLSDGSMLEAELVGADPRSDLAVLHVDLPAGQLQPIALVDTGQVKVGQLAIAIGNPFGLSGTMTSGIVSGLSRSLPVELGAGATTSQALYSIPDVIQTDAAINPGNSGGVLVDDQGGLIGVTTAIESETGTNSGVGFVIPADIVSRIVPVLIEQGSYDHPYLGITGASLTPDLAEVMNLPQDQQGALVINVTPGGPAAQAGLRGRQQNAATSGGQMPLGGDVIIGIDGTPISEFNELISYLFNHSEAGQSVTLTLLRDGQQTEIQLKLGTLPGKASKSQGSPLDCPVESRRGAAMLPSC